MKLDMISDVVCRVDEEALTQFKAALRANPHHEEALDNKIAIMDSLGIRRY